MTQTERDEMLIRLDIGVNGNGAKGLTGRVDDLEDWKETRPRECPSQKPDRGTIMLQRTVEVGVIGLVLAAGNLAGKALGWW